MLRLLLLGRISLTDADGRSLDAVLRQPKRLALLAYLALAGDAVRRDTLLTLFWPELDDRRARRALSQAVYYLVRALGEGVIAGGRGEALSVAGGSIVCDVRAVEAALAAGNAAEALDLYRGELLPGFFLDGCPDWQDWVDRERTRLSAAVAAAATTLAAQEEAAGNLLAAVQWARRAARCSPLTEGLLRDFMSMLARAGDRAGALDEYRRYAQWLREGLDEEPEAETRLLADELRSFVGEAAVVQSAATPGPPPAVPAPGSEPMVVARADLAAAEEAAEDHGQRPGPPPIPAAERRRWRGVGAVVLAASVLAIGGIILHARTHPVGSEPDRVRIAVIPFQELGASPASLGRLAAALTAAVADQLAEVPTFEVVPVQDPRFPGRGGEGARDDASTGGVALLLTGAVLGAGHQIRFRYSLVDARTGAIEQTDTLDRPGGDTLSLVDGAARAITAGVRVEVGRRLRVARWADDPKLTSAGRLVEEADWLARRARALQQAGALAAARQALDGCDSLLASAAQEAPRWPEPWIERARTAEQVGSLDLLSPHPDMVREEAAWDRGVAFASAAIAVDPQEGRAWEMRGVLRYMLWGTLAGESRPRDELLDSVTADLQRATVLNHLLPRAWSILSAALGTQGRLAEAAEAAEEALQADVYLENSEEILLRLYETSLDLGRDSAAARWCAEVNRRYQGSVVAASCTLGLLAWSSAPPPLDAGGPWRVVRAVRESPGRIQQFEPELEMQVAAVLARSGRRDSARAVIRRAAAKAGPHASPPLLRLEALALATAGDRLAADSVTREFAKYDPAAARRLRLSRAFATLAHTRVQPMVGGKASRHHAPNTGRAHAALR